MIPLLALTLFAGVPMLTAGIENDDAIYGASLEFGVSHRDLAALARCESGPRMDQLVGDGGASRGLFHFHLPTAFAWGRRLGYHGDMRDDPVASARMTALKFSVEGTYRQGWTNCAELLGLP